MEAGLVDAIASGGASRFGAAGTAAGFVDVGIRVTNDAQDGTARFGTGVAIVSTLTGAGTGALIGGPVGAAVGAVVGLIGALIGSAADTADAAVEKEQAGKTSGETRSL